MDLGESFDAVCDIRESTISDFASDGVHPSVILRDVASRLWPGAHVIVFANEKGGVGKSTLAFHCCVALANAGKKVLAVDLDRRQHSLETLLTNRDATAKSLQLDFPRPRHFLLQKQTGAMLYQEVMREGHNCDYLVIDVAGHDSTIARYAMAMADTLVTPVNGSSMDLTLLGRFDPVTKDLKELGCFARLVRDLREERLRRGLSPTDWIVMKNRLRSENKQQDRIDYALEQLAPAVGFRIGRGFGERVTYRELLTFGLTHLDRKYFPKLTRTDFQTAEEMLQLIEDLNLPERAQAESTLDRRWRFKPFGRSSRAFSESLYAHMQPRSPRFAKTA
jgi:chromosome partitioning protein